MSYGQRLIHSVTKSLEEERDASYIDAREAWRLAQSDSDIRGIAYEYKIGHIDDCTEDAWIEYQRRFGEAAKGPREEFTKKRHNGRAAKSPKRRSKAA